MHCLLHLAVTGYYCMLHEKKAPSPTKTAQPIDIYRKISIFLS